MKKVTVLSILFLILAIGLPDVHAHGGYNILSPDDPVMGDPDVEDNWYDNEAPHYSIDGDTGTKFLHFRHDNTPVGIRVTPQELKVVQGIRLTTANDFPGWDPVYFELYGSDAALDGQDWTLIAEGPIPDFVGGQWPRHTANQTPLVFSNDTAYTHYRLLFTESAGRNPDEHGEQEDGLGFMQISVIELLAFTDDILFYLEQQPQDYRTWEGEDALFEVAAYSETGDQDLEYQWYYSEDDVIDTDFDTPLSDGSSFLLENVSELDEGYYYAQVTHLTTGETLYTRMANLEIRYGRVISEATVQDVFSADDLNLPEGVFYATTMNSEPNSVQGVEFATWNDEHPFNISAGNLEPRTGNMNWQGQTDDDIALAEIAGTYYYSDWAIHISAADLVPGNEYEVYLLLALGNDADSRSMRLIMFGDTGVDDTITYIDLRGGQDVEEGEPAPLTVVSFTAVPDEHGNIWGEIIWSGEGPLYEGDGAVLSGALVVGEGSLSIVRQPQDQIIYPGETAQFNIESIGVADPVYTWYESRRGTIVGTGDTLIVDNVDVDDERYYYCVVTSEAIPGLEAISRQAALGVKRLRAHWSLDEADLLGGDYIDLSGEGNHIWEYSYGFEVQFVDGVFGEAVMIDEYSGFGDMNEHFDPSEVTGQLTVSFWLNWNGPRDSTQTFVGKRNAGEWNDQDMHWIICTGHNDNTLQFKNPRVHREVPNVLTDDGQWQHIAVTFDGELARIYVDGELRLEDGFELVEAYNAPMVLGAKGNANEWTDGAMDDVKIWNHPLSHEDIAAIYYSGTGVRPCIDPVGDGADLTGDCMVTVEDISVLLQQWLEDGTYPNCLPDNCD